GHCRSLRSRGARESLPNGRASTTVPSERQTSSSSLRDAAGSVAEMSDLVLPVLRGERLIMRPLTEEHLDRLVEVMWDPSVRRWWGTVASPEELREALRHARTALALALDGGVA